MWEYITFFTNSNEKINKNSDVGWDWVKVVVPTQEKKFHALYKICSILRIQYINPVKSGVNMRKKVYTNLYMYLHELEELRMMKTDDDEFWEY